MHPLKVGMLSLDSLFEMYGKSDFVPAEISQPNVQWPTATSSSEGVICSYAP